MYIMAVVYCRDTVYLYRGCSVDVENVKGQGWLVKGLVLLVDQNNTRSIEKLTGRICDLWTCINIFTKCAHAHCKWKRTCMKWTHIKKCTPRLAPTHPMIKNINIMQKAPTQYQWQ